jgi:hypothetical protein
MKQAISGAMADRKGAVKMTVKNGTKFCPKIDQGSPPDHPRISPGSPKDLPRITQKRVLAKEKFLKFHTVP